MRVLLAVMAAVLASSSAALAWVRVSPDTVGNIVEPSVLRLADGTELVAWWETNPDVLKVRRLPGAAKTVFTGASVGTQPQMLQLPNGSVQLYVPASTSSLGMQGILRFQSTDSGQSWSGPVQTASPNLFSLTGAALRPDGTPVLLSESTGQVEVRQGLNAESAHNLFAPCCGYAGSVAVDSTGLAQVAFFSNANSPKGFLYGALASDGSLAGSLLQLPGSGSSIPRNDRVPLLADGSGNTFVAWSVGYPTSTAMNVSTFRGGKLVRTVRTARGGFSGAEPHMALAVDPQGRLWAAWTRGGALWAARSRTAGSSFGAVVRSSVPGGRTVYQLSAIAQTAGLDVFANLGSTKNGLWQQRLLPGLTVIVSKKAVRVLDDGAPVAAAKVAGGGHVTRTNARGVASLKGFPSRVRLKVTAAGYTPATARAPR